MLKVLLGVVSRVIDDKTIVVVVQRKAVHPLYKKVIKINKKYLVDKDVDVAVHINENVSIMQSRPISKRKKWKILVN
jgi:small subunit ribosomal protein S17